VRAVGQSTEVEKARRSGLGAVGGAKEVYMVAETDGRGNRRGATRRDAHREHGDRHRGGTTEIAVIALSGIVSDTSIPHRWRRARPGHRAVHCARNYNLLIGEPTAEQIKDPDRIGRTGPGRSGKWK